MLRSLFAGLVLVAVFCDAAAAHDNVIVHRRMAQESVQIVDSPFFTPYLSDVREGSYGEDVPATRSLGHFYNPQTDSAPWFALGAGPAWQNSQDQYDAAVSQFNANNLTGEDAAYYRMGRALHFVQDMTSVAHVHDDQHATDGEDFEDWGKAHIGDFDYSNVVPKIAATPTAAGFVKEVARYVYDLTAYQADIDENTGPQADSVFKRMFPSLHWEDGGFLGDDVWDVDRIGTFDCFGNGVLCNDGWWMIDETLNEDSSGRGGSRRLRGFAYVENTGGNSAEPVPQVFNGEANTSGETMLHIYGRLLYPVAIAYGAGLLEVFEQQVHPAPPTATPTSTSAAPTATPPETPTPTASSPTVTATPTGPTPTPSDTPPPTPLCPQAPRSGCSTVAANGKSMLMLHENGDRDVLLWKWLKGDVPPGGYGNPVTGGVDYALCIYTESGGVPALASRADIPAGGTCAGKPCWKGRGSGYLYKDKDTTPHGVKTVVLREGVDGRGRIVVKGKGSLLPMPGLPLPQSPRVIVQLVNTAGGCWTSEFSSPALRNDEKMFRDKTG